MKTQPSPYSDNQSALYQVVEADHSEAELRLQEIYALKKEVARNQKTIEAQAEALAEAKERILDLEADMEYKERLWDEHYGKENEDFQA